MCVWPLSTALCTPSRDDTGWFPDSFLIATTPFQVCICVPESSLINFHLCLLRRAVEVSQEELGVSFPSEREPSRWDPLKPEKMQYRVNTVRRDSQLLVSSRGKQKRSVSGGMGQPVSPLLLPWLPRGLCSGNLWVGHSRGAPGPTGKSPGDSRKSVA